MRVLTCRTGTSAWDLRDPEAPGTLAPILQQPQSPAGDRMSGMIHGEGLCCAHIIHTYLLPLTQSAHIHCQTYCLPGKIQMYVILLQG
jgi:hypothetical protein